MLSEEEKFAINTLEFVEKHRTNNDKYTLKALDSIHIVLDLIKKQEHIINEVQSRLEKHIQQCELDAGGSLHNDICYISLKFDRNLLDLLNNKE